MLENQTLLLNSTDTQTYFSPDRSNPEDDTFIDQIPDIVTTIFAEESDSNPAQESVNPFPVNFDIFEASKHPLKRRFLAFVAAIGDYRGEVLTFQRGETGLLLLHVNKARPRTNELPSFNRHKVETAIIEGSLEQYPLYRYEFSRDYENALKTIDNTWIPPLDASLRR